MPADADGASADKDAMLLMSTRCYFCCYMLLMLRRYARQRHITMLYAGAIRGY